MVTARLFDWHVPVLDSPFGEEIFSNIQSESSLEQLEAVFSCYLGGHRFPTCFNLFSDTCREE